MKTLKALVFGTLAAGLFVFAATPASAQETVDDPADGVEAVLKKRAVEGQSERSVLLQFLQESKVGEVASEHGIDLDNLKGRVKTMSDREVSVLWEKLQDLDDSLAGGDSITIASSTLIIILLIIILIQVS